MALGVCPKSLGNFYGQFREQGFCRLTFLEGENQLYQIWSYYISLECKIYTDLKMQKKLSENQYLRRIHGIIDSIRKLDLFAQAEKQNYGAFWKIGVLK